MGLSLAALTMAWAGVGQLTPASGVARAPVTRTPWSVPAARGPQPAPAGRDRHALVFSTDDSRFEASTANQGWWATSGIDNVDANDNYLVGRLDCCDNSLKFRDFFTFDLRLQHRTVVAAALRINTGELSSDDPQTLRLSDVSTDAATLNNTTGQNDAIFTDLGTGMTYGDYEITKDQQNTVVRLTLNRQAVHDINRSHGRFFSIGGSLADSTAVASLFSFGDHTPVDLLVWTSYRR
jgi:hypothetical protein